MFQWHLCDAHFCIMLCHSRVSHPSLQCAGAFVASSTLSQTIKHHAFFIRFFVENDQPTVYRHTHTRLWWIMRWTQFIWLRCTISNLECSKQYGYMIARFPNMCLLHRIVSNCFSVFQHVFPNCIFQHWMCSDEQVKKNKLDVFQWNFPLLGFSNLISKLDYPKSAANPNLARSSRCQVQTESWLNLDWVQSDSRYPHHPHLSSSSSSSCCRRLWTWKKIVCRCWSKSGASRRLGLDWV